MNEIWHTFKDITINLSIIGIPSVFAGTIWCIKKCRDFTKMLTILMNAEKAEMRKQLLDEYQVHKSLGYISERDLQEWENRWKCYHVLQGDNGILEERREYLLKLPSAPPVEDIA